MYCSLNFYYSLIVPLFEMNKLGLPVFKCLWPKNSYLNSKMPGGNWVLKLQQLQLKLQVLRLLSDR